MARNSDAGPVARLGLRSRLIATFALGALLLSVLMGAIAFATTRHFLVGERRSAALHQAYANAALLRNGLAANVPRIDTALTSLDTGPGSASLLDNKGQWFSTSLAVSRSSLPAPLRSTVAQGHVATQASQPGSTASLAVGVPLPSVHAAYYLVYDLTDLQHTLRVLLYALGAAAVVTTLLGAGVGLAASRRTMRPLAQVSDAAVAIAGGQLDTRLPVDRADPDLVGLTTSFNAMVDRLQDRLERDARFTSDVSHELRSPLTTLAAALGVLERHSDELSDTGRQALVLLAGDLGRFQRLVADLLEISRADADVDDVALEEVEAGEIVRRAVAAAAASLPSESSPEVSVTPAADHARLLVDKRRMERVMGNLLENASHYAGGATRVTVRTTPGGSTVEIAVIDRGPGIPVAERARVFDRFYRAAASGRRGDTNEGSGLGLALVAEHIRRQGGTVSVGDSPDGQGSAFLVTLPVVSPGAAR